MKNLFIILTLFLSFSAIASEKLGKCTCISTLQDELEEARKVMINSYEMKKSFLKIDNDPEFLEGTNTEEAVILIHGFIASPFEVKSLATRLNQAGYSVYMPLLNGFGANGDQANTGRLPFWKKQVKESVERLSKCYKKISIGGISLGAALASDYVLNNKTSQIKSLILLSPYFDVSQSVAKLLVGPLSSIKESLDLSTLYIISRSSDLVEIIKHKEHYSDIMPFLALSEIFKLSDEIKSINLKQKNNVPVYLAYSEFDTTIDLKIADELPKKLFNNVTTFVLPKALSVPHQITYESSNPKFKEMVRKIRLFIYDNYLDSK